MGVIFLAESTARARLYATHTRESEGLCSEAGEKAGWPPGLGCTKWRALTAVLHLVSRTGAVLELNEDEC